MDPLIGSTVKVMVDYRQVKENEVSVNRGDVVTVLEIESNAYKIATCQSQEGWVPSYVLTLISPSAATSAAGAKKHGGWNFKKFRRPSFGRKDKSVSSGSLITPTSVCVAEADTAVLKCHKTGSTTLVSWRKNGSSAPLTAGKKYSFEHDEHQAFAVLYISNCGFQDAGEYLCLQQSNVGSTVSSSAVNLTVTAKMLPPEQPKVVSAEVRDGSHSARLEWPVSEADQDMGRVFTVESCRLHSSSWLAVKRNIAGGSCNIHRLEPGETYGFRVFSHCTDGGDRSEPSLPSQPLFVPNNNSNGGQESDPLRKRSSRQDLDSCWQRDFERRYIELEELGRGRFSVVRRCQEILSGSEVAVKFINRRRQNREATKREYELMTRFDSHPHLIPAHGLYLTATSDAIVLGLVAGHTTLFEHFCAEPNYTELAVAVYARQLLDALAYIHSKDVVHLDIKPENVLLDANADKVKLIDFGGAREIDPRYSGQQQQQGDIQAAGSLDENREFFAPEVISSGPVGAYTDMWGFGVFLYVALSGLSPFLDDSDDETVNNILRCDFSFPAEYFSSISETSKDLISRMLSVNPSMRPSANSALESVWIKNRQQRSGRISSLHLSTLVRRRMKKLNAVGPTTMALQHAKLRHNLRPESLYQHN